MNASFLCDTAGVLDAVVKKKRPSINIQRSMKARSRKNYCRGRAILIIYFECVSLPLVAQRVKSMRRITFSYVAHLAPSYFP